MNATTPTPPSQDPKDEDLAIEVHRRGWRPTHLGDRLVWVRHNADGSWDMDDQGVRMHMPAAKPTVVTYDGRPLGEAAR